jgi:hypothetical protein
MRENIMLKFAELANVGDVIKAYDFKPMEGRDDCFLTGRVIRKGSLYKGHLNGDEIVSVYLCEGYEVEVIGGDAESAPFRKGNTMYVPFEIDFMEFDNRVELVATEAEVEMLIAAESEKVFH